MAQQVNLPIEKSIDNQQIKSIQTQTAISHKEFNRFVINQNICIKLLPKCLSLNDVVTERNYYFNSERNYQLIEFPLVINLNKLIRLGDILNLTKNKRKRLIQLASQKLNNLSAQWFKKRYSSVLKNHSVSVLNIAVNNSLILYKNDHFIPISHVQTNHENEQRITIGILDSGISTYHQQMNQIDVVQFNPHEQSFDLRDTAFGHASGILSLLAVQKNDEIDEGFIENGKYLSCNGLPKGKYNPPLILQCMNWFFLKSKVDVVINAWLATSAGCKNEWQHPIEALLAADVIPIFSAGNYAQSKKQMNFSPANLVLDNIDYPLVTVGALDYKSSRLTSSSYGLTQCKNEKTFRHFQANIFAKGDQLKVAIPFAKNTYQMVSGSSYSIAEVASIIAKLILRFPRTENKTLINSILQTSDRSESDSNLGYGRINSEKIKTLLLKTNQKNTNPLKL